MNYQKCTESTGAESRLVILGMSGCMNYPLVCGAYPKRKKRYKRAVHRKQRSTGDMV